jgi:serine/threonine protein kinase
MPWQDSWEIVTEHLGGGGQGLTHLVRHKADDRMGVLKELKFQNQPQARQRMYREAVNLETLAKTSAKVPAVLESNAEQYEDLTVPLYLVMEHIDGPTLHDFIASSGPLPLADALQMSANVGHTVKAGHAETIQHRDLKPRNIVLKGASHSDPSGTTPYVVDYGLSFNSSIDSDLTRMSETLWNEFITLPETNVQGEDRRDKRSDVTAVAGVLYYCLTGHVPGLLVNSQDLPPHRRPETSVGNVVSDLVLRAHLNVLFDRAFSSNLERRFADCAELLEAISDLASLVDRPAQPDIKLLAQHASETLRSQNRPTQLMDLRRRSNEIRDHLNKLLHKFITAKIDLYQFEIGENDPGIRVPGGFDKVGSPLRVRITCIPTKLVSEKSYTVAARGMDLVLLTFVKNFGDESLTRGETPLWQELCFVDLKTLPEDALVIDDLQQWCAEQIEAMLAHSISTNAITE